ncbi:MAG: amidohydrolase family protein [Woeseiaceae bacterium]
MSTWIARARLIALGGAAMFFGGIANAQVYLTEGTNISVDAAADGRLAIDLLGDLWVVPADGGEATALASGRRVMQRPRWSPSSETIVYESALDGQNDLRLYELASGEDRMLGDGRWMNRHPDWHPDGDRVVFSSVRHDSAFDIWEIDVPTGLAWRLTRRPGDESEPTWSSDGRDLLYVHQYDGRWSIVMRRRGQADKTIVSSTSRLAAPSWRPDGSLITYLRRTDNAWSVWMTILSEPPLDRTMIDGEDFFIAPVTWIDRQRLLYAANGKVRKREFNAWSSSDVPFRVNVAHGARPGSERSTQRELETIDEPAGRTVVRAGRLYDGVNGGYYQQPDIVIERGLVTAIGSRRDHEDAIVIDLGDLTVVPGFIDAHAVLPAGTDERVGPLLLSVGVTTLVARHANAAELNATWAGKDIPGPRVVSHDWKSRFESGAASFVNNNELPLSPAGRRYQDVLFGGGPATTIWLSGLADGGTPGVDSIWESRQARAISSPQSVARRFSETPDLSAVATSVVLGSLPTGLPAGIALHAELRALVAAGLSEEQALKSAGVNAAGALGFNHRIGRVAVGSAADMLLIDGDPLEDISDAIKIVGVVRNGRFFSVSGLLERAPARESVE